MGHLSNANSEQVLQLERGQSPAGQQYGQNCNLMLKLLGCACTIGHNHDCSCEKRGYYAAQNLAGTKFYKR